MLAACSFNSTGLTATSTNTTDVGTTTSPASTGDDPQPTTGAPGTVCTPGTPAACECPFGPGQHTCNPDGNGYGPCDCPDDPGTSSTTAVLPGTTTTATTTDDPDTTSTSGSSTSAPDTTSGDDTTSDTTTSGGDSSSSAESSTGDDSSSSAESSTGETCEQTDPEPNGTFQQAVAKTDIACGQGKPGSMTTGVLDGDQDVDWFKYHGAYNSPNCGDTNPTMVYTLTAEEPIRLCVFGVCGQNMGAAVMCGNGSMPAMDANGTGCCGMANFQFEFNCNGGDDESAEVFLRLDGAKPDSCVEYTVTYDYQDK